MHKGSTEECDATYAKVRFEDVSIGKFLERRDLTVLMEDENKEAMPAAAVAAMLW